MSPRIRKSTGWPLSTVTNIALGSGPAEEQSERHTDWKEKMKLLKIALVHMFTDQKIKPVTEYCRNVRYKANI